MKFKIDPFEKYLDSARETELEILESNSPLIAALRTYHEFFAGRLFTEHTSMSPVQCLLALHSFMLYLCSIRIAISGHGSATFPLFRTALESSSYAFLIGERPQLQQIWMERNHTPEALRLCRNEFTSAVKHAARIIQTKSWATASTADWVGQAYDAAIDFGAHPNPMAIWPYVQMDEDRPDGYISISLASIYGPTSHETSRTLMACLDYGLLIAVILTSCLEHPPNETLIELNELNALKESLTEELFPEAFARATSPT